MATLPKNMSYAVPQQVASAEANNAIIDNVTYLGTDLTDTQSLVTNHTGRLDADHARLTTLENRTTNATSGNTQLSDRLATVESRTTAAKTGNAALGTRVSTLETSGAAIVTGSGYLSVYQTASQTIYSASTSASNARVEWNTTETPPAGVSLSDNNRTITLTKGGLWLVSVFVRLSGNFAAPRLVLWLGPPTSGTSDRYGFAMIQPTTSLQDPGTSFTIQKRFAANGAFSVYCFQDSGVNQSTLTQFRSTALTATLLAN